MNSFMIRTASKSINSAIISMGPALNLLIPMFAPSSVGLSRRSLHLVDADVAKNAVAIDAPQLPALHGFERSVLAESVDGAVADTEQVGDRYRINDVWHRAKSIKSDAFALNFNFDLLSVCCRLFEI